MIDLINENNWTRANKYESINYVFCGDKIVDEDIEYRKGVKIRI